jgi:serine/threonine protein kinase
MFGRGGWVGYLALDLSLDRPVALKLIAPELADDEQFRARFLREPELAASLDHPNVIPINEAGQHDGQLYLAMRFVEGSELRFNNGDITPAQVHIFRVTGRAPAGEEGFDLFDGAVVDHVFEVPARLSG